MIQIGTRVVMLEKCGFFNDWEDGMVGIIEAVDVSSQCPSDTNAKKYYSYKILVEERHTTLYNCDESDFEVIVENL